MVVSDRTGGYYQRPDLTKLTEEAVQQAASSARRRKVIAQELGVAVDEQPVAEETPAHEETAQVPVAPAPEEPRPEEQPHHTDIFNLDELLGLTGSQPSDGEVQA